MRLSAIRAEMKRANITAYLVPSTDAHQSEYLAPEDRRRQYITGKKRVPEDRIKSVSTGHQRKEKKYISEENMAPEDRRR